MTQARDFVILSLCEESKKTRQTVVRLVLSVLFSDTTIIQQNHSSRYAALALE